MSTEHLLSQDEPSLEPNNGFSSYQLTHEHAHIKLVKTFYLACPKPSHKPSKP